jgi:hypothetical protein
MAGQPRRGTRGQGRSSHGDSSWPALAVVSGVASGSATDTLILPDSPETQEALHTRATYRTLLLKGMAPDEAANLTAYMAGIPIGESHWTLSQVNQLLFLRQMQRTGRFDSGTETTTN